MRRGHVGHLFTPVRPQVSLQLLEPIKGSLPWRTSLVPARMTVSMWFPRHEDLSSFLVSAGLEGDRSCFQWVENKTSFLRPVLMLHIKMCLQQARLLGLCISNVVKIFLTSLTNFFPEWGPHRSYFITVVISWIFFIYRVIYTKLLIFLCSNRHSSHISNKWDCVTRCILWIAWRYYHRTVCFIMQVEKEIVLFPCWLQYTRNSVNSQLQLPLLHIPQTIQRKKMFFWNHYNLEQLENMWVELV